MKLQAIKPHYYETTYVNVKGIYMADKIHGEAMVRNGICKEIKPKAKPKKKK